MMVVRRFILIGILAALLLALAACGTAVSSASAQSSEVVASATPRVVTPRNSGGRPGQGPAVVATPEPVPGGPAGSQEVTLGDRTLIIYSAHRQQSSNAHAVLINLDLAVSNTSGKAIQNLAAFFQLLGPEGDAFSYQSNSSDSFYGQIAAHTTDRGSITFQVPTAASAKMSLFYRPELARDAVILQLKIA